MRSVHLILFALLFAACFLYFGMPNPHVGKSTASLERSEESAASGGSHPSILSLSEATPPKGPELEQWYFRRWHEPYGNVLSPEMLNQMWSEVHRLPSETDFAVRPVNSWEVIGPWGMANSSSPGTYYSGRILDIEPPQNGATTRIASASGGLWQYFILVFLAIPVPMSNEPTSQAAATFATKPSDKNTVFLGTGEQWQRGGTGLWKTVDGGSNWTNVSITPTPSAFYRIRYSPGNPNVIHAVTSLGYYRSDDGGVTWTRKYTGNMTDLAIDPVTPSNLYAGKWGDTLTGGLYYSASGGDAWTKIVSPRGIPPTNVGRTAVTICNSNPNVIYVLMTRNDNYDLLGVYKSTNRGVNWTNVSPTASDLGGNGWYNAVISVSPTNPNIVLVGMTNLLRTSNGGASWTVINTPDVHVDHHAITWSSDGTKVWNGNDGGMSYSSDAGVAWATIGNNFAITQYYNFDVGITNPQVVFGGSQDNGLSGRTNAGSTWKHTFGGDGAGIAIDPNDASNIYAVDGAFGGSLLFRREKSGNYGQSWTDFSSGITDDDNWAPRIRTDRQSPYVIYTNAKQYVYQSVSPYSSWTKLNTTAFPAEVTNVTVSRGGVVYACLGSATTGSKLRVYDGGTWSERSTGLPGSIRTVAVHPIRNNTAYALINGFSAGQKIYKTTDRGLTWTNVTGDLPNIPVGDLVPHPGSILFDSPKMYLGTELGCYRTTNGGVNWHRWNNGMPESNIVTEMNYIDSLSINGKFYIVAGTFGRSIWTREISGDDPVDVAEQSTLPQKYELFQNYPNPFNPSTTIKLSLPEADVVDLRVFDVAGREVKILSNQHLNAGVHSFTFDGANLSSGVYFYRMKTSTLLQTKTMLLIK